MNLHSRDAANCLPSGFEGKNGITLRVEARFGHDLAKICSDRQKRKIFKIKASKGNNAYCHIKMRSNSNFSKDPIRGSQLTSIISQVSQVLTSNHKTNLWIFVDTCEFL